jgi:trehalose 6-phosphate synthase
MMAHSVFRKMIVGVDRLDYSKGLEERLIGFERFLHDNPEARREVMLLQIAPLSRDEVEAYQDLRARLDGLIGRINGAYAEMDSRRSATSTAPIAATSWRGSIAPPRRPWSRRCATA